MITLIFLNNQVYYSIDLDHKLDELQCLNAAIAKLKEQKNKIEQLRKVMPY